MPVDSRRHERQRGQAAVEYVLTVLVSLSIVTALAVGFRRSLYALWEHFARKISAACPSCPAETNVRIR